MLLGASYHSPLTDLSFAHFKLRLDQDNDVRWYCQERWEEWYDKTERDKRDIDGHEGDAFW
jgi:hypothetical protein